MGGVRLYFQNYLEAARGRERALRRKGRGTLKGTGEPGTKAYVPHEKKKKKTLVLPSCIRGISLQWLVKKNRKSVRNTMGSGKKKYQEKKKNTKMGNFDSQKKRSEGNKSIWTKGFFLLSVPHKVNICG